MRKQVVPLEDEKDITPPTSEIGFLHEIGSRFAAADSLHSVLNRVVHFVATVVQCDSCFVYVLEDEELVLRASKTPHADVVDRLRLRVGQGLTGWVAEHRQPIAIPLHAFDDRRFQLFNELPEDRYEAFLSVPVLCRGRLVAVINLQHRDPHEHSANEIQLVSTVGFLVGAEIELARLESENSQLAERLETRKMLDRAKGILQRDLGITEEEAYLTIQRQSRQRQAIETRDRRSDPARRRSPARCQRLTARVPIFAGPLQRRRRRVVLQQSSPLKSLAVDAPPCLYRFAGGDAVCLRRRFPDASHGTGPLFSAVSIAHTLTVATASLGRRRRDAGRRRRHRMVRRARRGADGIPARPDWWHRLHPRRSRLPDRVSAGLCKLLRAVVGPS